MKKHLSKKQVLFCLQKYKKEHLLNFIINNNKELLFECDDFGNDFERLVWFKHDKKYSLLNVDEKKFNRCRAIPKELNSKCINGLCISNKINIKNSERFSNFCVLNNKIIIYDEECYLNFLELNEELQDYLLKKINYDEILAFENDHLIYLKNNIIIKYFY